MELSDARLIEEIQAGSGIAFEFLMRRYERLVYSIAYSHVARRESALDITQNVFLKVSQSLDSLRSPGAFKAWLLQITFRESLNWLRSNPELFELSESAECESARADMSEVEEQLLEGERRKLLTQSLGRLRPHYQLAVILRYFEDKSIRDIAGVLGCSDGTVKSILYRSLRQMRRRLSPILEEVL
jgi:RNA polymerase sigma-70 factor (ECF subfamily)